MTINRFLLARLRTLKIFYLVNGLIWENPMKTKHPFFRKKKGVFCFYAISLAYIVYSIIALSGAAIIPDYAENRYIYCVEYICKANVYT